MTIQTRPAHIEEQIAGLKLMCSALICYVHFTAEKHTAAYPSSCEEEVCKRYTEGLHKTMWGWQP